MLYDLIIKRFVEIDGVLPKMGYTAAYAFALAGNERRGDVRGEQEQTQPREQGERRDGKEEKGL